jgi:hypothetical protein
MTMTIAVAVCSTLILAAAALTAAAMKRARRPYQPGHSRRAPAAPAAVVPVPAPRPLAPPVSPAESTGRPLRLAVDEANELPCSPADLTVLDLPPLLARRYVQAAGQEERP